MFFFTTWILPVVFLIPTIIFYSKLGKYSSFEIELAKYSSGKVTNEINGYRTCAAIFLVFFIILVISGIIDCINTAMKSLTLTPTQIAGRNGLSNLKTIRLVDVTEIKVNHGVFGGAFHYGMITVKTTMGNYRFKKFYDPDGFVEEANRLTMSLKASAQTPAN